MPRRIKIFLHEYASKLEDDVNQWLAEHPFIVVVSAHFCPENDFVSSSVMLDYYQEEEPINAEATVAPATQSTHATNFADASTDDAPTRLY